MLKSKVMADKVENLTDCVALLNGHCFGIFNYQVYKNCYGEYELTVQNKMIVIHKADSSEELYRKTLKLCYDKNLINPLGYVIIGRNEKRFS